MDNGDLGRMGELVQQITAVDESAPDSYDSFAYNAQRGAKQKHYGFSPNYSLGRLPADMGGQVCPRLVGGSVPPEVQDVFRLRKSIKEEDHCRFVVVTLQNGPSHTCKWKSFATLVLKGTKCFARVEKKQSNNDEAYFLLADNVIVDKATVLPTVATVQTLEASECSASSGDSDQKRPHFKIEHPTYPTYPCNKKIKPASPRKQHSAITATDRTPTEIDPFRRSELKDPAYMKNKITLWKAHWSCQLSCWKSTYSLRAIGGTVDRYWFPPNTTESDVTVRIRSAPDLTSFLDYCVSQQPVCNGDSVAPNLVDYGLLLRQWGETRKSTRKM